jgi:hypothetical protein
LADKFNGEWVGRVNSADLGLRISVLSRRNALSRYRS